MTIFIITPPFKKVFSGGDPNQNTLYVPKERIVTLIAATGCEGPSTMVRNPTYAVLSRVTRAMRGGSQKVTNDDEGEGGGQRTPQK